MSEIIHGGDVYRNKVNIDFSVSINPCGVPAKVKDALTNAIDSLEKYPDIHCEKLTKAAAKMLDVKEEQLVFGNGSSDLFMGIANAFKPSKVLIAAPSFYGYEYAFSPNAENIVYYFMKEEDTFRLTNDFLNSITDDLDFIILANPNNPTGALIDSLLLLEIVKTAKSKKIRVILDECFIEFTEGSHSLVSKIEEYPNLCIIRSFTKIFAIPGVRLGYFVSSDLSFNETVKKHLAEWNISAFGQAAGCACTECLDYIEASKKVIKAEREYLYSEFSKLGIKAYDSACNFILIKDKRKLDEELLKREILVRNCSNFKGLDEGYYRIAVRTHEENVKLIEALKIL
ncbi:MAG: aminotransferase class I/II-fold pyridoxal phosphate-dependent enzyme [Lachnospiraceae bacterium]|nr:aminotransferase class I/II-fold pyridoxal phosphate-dependent enzyme [Lachnospiraceae bacterium]